MLEYRKVASVKLLLSKIRCDSEKFNKLPIEK